MVAIQYTVIKEAIDEWDPVALLITHAPADEYDSESTRVFNKLSDLPTANIEDLSRAIFEVFVESFGRDVFTLGLGECRRIARKILEATDKTG